MRERLLFALEHPDPILHVSALDGVNLGKDADGAPALWIRFVGEAGGSLILNIICASATSP